MRRFRNVDLGRLLIGLASLLATPVHAQSFEPVWLAVHPALFAAADEALLLRATDGSLWAREEDLRAWGVAPSGTSEAYESDHWYALASLRGVASRFDPAEQALWLDVDPNLRAIQVRPMGGDAARPDDAGIDPGGWIDLDMQATRAQGHTVLGGLGGASVFDRWGFGTANAFFAPHRTVRLDTTWTVDDPDRVERLDLGDGIHDSGPAGGAVRFGGASFGTDFSLQPDLITFPVPELHGVARLPSTLDVYVNGLLARRESIDPGPFVLTDLPAQTGQGEARVVMRDMLGRQQVLTQPFYGSSQLLRPGLSDWRLDGGWLREAYGFASARYGSGFVAGRWRGGLTSRLTVLTAVEADRRRVATGGGAAVGLPFGGIAHVDVAASHDDPGLGARVEAGFDYLRGGGAGGLSFGARVRRVTANWTELGEHRPSRDQAESANVAVNLQPGWSAGLTWSHTTANDRPAIDVTALDLTVRASESWFLSANLARVRADGGDWFAGVNLVGLWGGGTTVAGANHDSRGTTESMEWQKNARDALDDGYRVRAQSGADARLYAQSDWNSERGSVSAALDRAAHQTGVRAGATTRVAWLGDDLFWTRPGPDGFAVVDTHGLSAVGVLQDHRLAARTDDRGLALLPGLRPWQSNVLGLVDGDIPIDAKVDALEQTVVPARRGGVRVSFPVAAPNGHAVHLAMPDGSRLPEGSTVHDVATGIRLKLDADGTAWWMLGEMPSRLEVEAPGRRCTVRLPPGFAVESVVRLECTA